MVDKAFDAAWQQVTCKDCGRHYECTPDDDYYARAGEVVTGPTDGLCSACLMKDPRGRYTVSATIQFEVHGDDMGEAATETEEALRLVRNGLPCLVTDLHIHQEP